MYNPVDVVRDYWAEYRDRWEFRWRFHNWDFHSTNIDGQSITPLQYSFWHDRVRYRESMHGVVVWGGQNGQWVDRYRFIYRHRDLMSVHVPYPTPPIAEVWIGDDFWHNNA